MGAKCVHGPTLHNDSSFIALVVRTSRLFILEVMGIELVIRFIDRQHVLMTDTIIMHTRAASTFFKRHRWGPNRDGLSEWVPGARFGRSKSHLNFWALLGVGLDPGPKWALGGLLESHGGLKFVPKKIKVDIF